MTTISQSSPGIVDVFLSSSVVDSCLLESNGDYVGAKLPVWMYSSTGMVSVLMSFSIVDIYLMESPRRYCSLYVISLGIQQRQDF